MTANGPWNDKNVAALKALVEEGLSTGQIAGRLSELGIHVTRNAVIGKCRRLNLELHGAQGRPGARPRKPKVVIQSEPGTSSPPAPDARRAGRERAATAPGRPSRTLVAGAGAASTPPRAPDAAPVGSKRATTGRWSFGSGVPVTLPAVRLPSRSPAKGEGSFSAPEMEVSRKTAAMGSATTLLQTVDLIVGVRLTEAEGWQCRYPVSGEGLTLQVCGAPAPEGRPYCPHHHAIAYRPASGPPRPPFDTSIARAPNRPREGDLVDTIGEAA